MSLKLFVGYNLIVAFIFLDLRYILIFDLLDFSLSWDSEGLCDILFMFLKILSAHIKGLEEGFSLSYKYFESSDD